MMLAMTLLALQPGGPAPDDRLACAPRQNLTRGGPPPPIFSAQRIEIEPRDEISLSVHRFPSGGFRVERRRQGPQQQQRGPLQWVPVAQCPALGRWIEATARLRLPSPMLTPHRDFTGSYRGTWFTLHARQIAASGRTGNLELEILHAPGAAPSVLSGWFRDGERVFRACRDRGHGGEGLLPFNHFTPRPRS